MRALMAAAAVLAGLGGALALGAPLAAVLLAIGAGAAAVALAWAPEADEAVPEPEESDPAPPLPALTDLLNAVDDPLLVIRDRRIVFANAAAKGVLGQHIEGSDIRLAIRHPAAAERLTEPAGAGEKVSRTELVGLGEQDRRWEMAIFTLDDDSRFVRLVDRSAAHASEQMRVDFVANASHELRTPLATLLGFLETLEDEKAAGDPATRGRFIKIMLDEARRMQRLVEDLLSLSRIEAERFRAPTESVPLLPLAEEVRVGCSRMIEDKGGRLLVEAEGFDPVALGDRAQLSQLLLNLVVNALKYGRAGEDVRIRFEAIGADMVRMSVIDRGDGIAPEHLPRLTERFYRVDAGRSRAVGGTGLGLAIVKHIVGRHRGRLEIESEPGTGTSVHISLPRAPAPPPVIKE